MAFLGRPANLSVRNGGHLCYTHAHKKTHVRQENTRNGKQAGSTDGSGNTELSMHLPRFVLLIASDDGIRLYSNITVIDPVVL